jgi:hypothetical protein
VAAKVTEEDRAKHSATGDGRFPINSRQQAVSALHLRGHNTTKAQRRAIIRRCAVFIPEMARRAYTHDKQAGLI